jgi:hypothetical protein
MQLPMEVQASISFMNKMLSQFVCFIPGQWCVAVSGRGPGVYFPGEQEAESFCVIL